MGRKYMDSKSGIFNAGYNNYVIDLSVYPLLTDASEISNGAELIKLLGIMIEKGSQISAVDFGASETKVYAFDKLSVNTSNVVRYAVTETSDLEGAIITFGKATYSEGKLTVAIETATTAWDT